MATSGVLPDRNASTMVALTSLMFTWMPLLGVNRSVVIFQSTSA